MKLTFILTLLAVVSVSDARRRPFGSIFPSPRSPAPPPSERIQAIQRSRPGTGVVEAAPVPDSSALGPKPSDRSFTAGSPVQ